MKFSSPPICLPLAPRSIFTSIQKPVLDKSDRLNTGAMKLNNQEIRNCIYAGKFNDLLKQLNEESQWMRINRMKTPIGYRFTKQEIILRFFAFRDCSSKYTGQLAKFLNEYMEDNRNPQASDLAEKQKVFERTINIVYQKVFAGKIPTKLTVTFLESLLVGVSLNLDHLESLSNTAIAALAEKLRTHSEFSEERLSEGLSKTERVKGRLTAAEDVLSGK